MARRHWRGVLLDDRTADMLEEVARNTGNIYVRPTQGSYSTSVGASAGTHAGGGAVDIITGSPADMRVIVREARRVGFAAWLRTPAQSSWPYHVHAIAVGCRDLSPAAAAQVRDYRNGLNGLAGRGRDDGPRDHVGVTWESYQASRPTPEPEPEPTPPSLAEGEEMRVLYQRNGEGRVLRFILSGGRLMPIGHKASGTYSGPSIKFEDPGEWERFTRERVDAGKYVDPIDALA